MYTLSPLKNVNVDFIRASQYIAPKEITPTAQHFFSVALKCHWEFAKRSLDGEGFLWERRWEQQQGFPLGVRVRLEFPSVDGLQSPTVYERILDIPLGGQ